MNTVYVIVENSRGDEPHGVIAVCESQELAQLYVNDYERNLAARVQASTLAHAQFVWDQDYTNPWDTKPAFDSSKAADKEYVKQHQKLVEAWKQNTLPVLQQAALEESRLRAQAFQSLYDSILTNLDLTTVDLNMCPVDLEIMPMQLHSHMHTVQAETCMFSQLGR